MNWLEEDAWIAKAGTLTAQLSRLDVVVLDGLGNMPFARPGGQLLLRKRGLWAALPVRP